MLPQTKALHRATLLALRSERKVTLHCVERDTTDDAEPTALWNVMSPHTSLLTYSSFLVKTAPFTSNGAVSTVSRSA